MNISYDWLSQYIDSGLTAEELAAALTSIGLETGSVEEVESIRGGLRGIVIGRVLTCTEHPDSDHLHVTTVDLGTGEPVQIVCGAPNVAAGQTVVVATVGTVLYDGDKEFKIKKSKIRGVESFGMICAEDEIGTGTSHDGIIVLPDGAAAPGTPAAEYYGLTSDHVLEVDLTPNRIDAASHYGVARDLAAWMSCHRTPVRAKLPDVGTFATDRTGDAVEVSVADAADCPRYCGVTIRGIKVAESPDWLRRRLTAIGLRPINNIVDITNYILHGIGQPLHCFDIAHIGGGKVQVMTVAEGTEFTTLDGVERKLDSRDLMICNGTGRPMCMAGVFGGLDSGVTETTTDVFIESACFNPTVIRKAARRHGLNTDSSFRFERGVDPNGCLYAMKLAALMIRELAGGEICGPVVDLYPAVAAPYPVELSYSQIDTLVGKHIEPSAVDSILDSLEIKISGRKDDGRVLELEVPTYRVDVQRPCDVIEDILRIYGYNNVEMPSHVKASLAFRTPTDAADALCEHISDQLSAQGFNEILNNSLTARSYYDGLQTYPAEKCVSLLNPLSGDLSLMRQTLLFGGLESIAHNRNRRALDLALYETGNVYFLNPEAESTAEAPLKPYSEGSRIALWICGDWRQAGWMAPAEESTFYHLKAAVQNLLDRLGIDPKSIRLTPTQAIDLLSAGFDIADRSGKPLGMMGIVARQQLRKFDIDAPVYFAELDRAALTRMALRHKVSYTPLPKTQPVRRDLALLVDSDVTLAQIEAAAAEGERKLLRDFWLFDVYEGKNLPEGKKSYAVAMTLQDEDNTLTDRRIDDAMSRIVASIGKRTGATLR